MLVDRGPNLDPMRTSSLCFLSSPIQNSDKYDFRTARINLVQDNAETIISIKIGILFCLKSREKLKN